MKRSIYSKVLMAALASATLGTATVASASTVVYLSLGVPAVHAAPAQVGWPVYDTAPRYDDDWRYQQERAWRGGCRAARWDPSFRYMPGQKVSRNGTVYVATGLSASVWNVNSPPEWTPNYWMATNCTSPRGRHAREWHPGSWR